MFAEQRSVLVHPCAQLAECIEIPGDKSISHRAAILCGLATGTSVVDNFLEAEDCLHTLHAMEALGAHFRFGEGRILHIQGTGGERRKPADHLYVGNSGTSMRLLAGLLASCPFSSELTGDASLSKRPMKRIKVPLERMGATVELLGKEDCAPIRISGKPLSGIRYALPVASAQVKSCILLAGLFSEGTTEVEEPLPTRDHTERLFEFFNIPIWRHNQAVKLEGYGVGGPILEAKTWSIPGDFSSAAFFMVAAAGQRGSSFTHPQRGFEP